jgi:hypothetical protein
MTAEREGFGAMTIDGFLPVEAFDSIDAKNHAPLQQHMARSIPRDVAFRSQ